MVWLNYRALQAEYDQLRRALGEQTEPARCEDSTTVAGAQTNGDVDMAGDVRQLRQHKGRLETRMRVLEEHNEQLDSQLRRLRQLLHDSQQVCYCLVTCNTEIIERTERAGLP